MRPDDLDDDLEMLREAWTAPRHDPARRAADLALAQENFARLHAAAQGPAAEARLSPDSPPGVWRGIKDMIDTLTGRGALTATTALVACGALLLTPLGQDLWQRGPFERGEATTAPAEPAPPAETAPAVTETETPRGRAAPEAAEAAPEVLAQRVQPEALAETAPAPTAPPPVAAPEPMAEFAGDAASDAEMESFSAAPSVALPAPSMLTRQAPGAGGVAAGAAADMALAPPLPDTEAFANADENPVRIAAEEPVSTFSIDVDTASYGVVRRSLTAGALPPPDAVRVEEMVNYFPYAFPAPSAEEGPFRPTIAVQPTPWNPDTRLVTVAIQGELPAVEDRPPLDLVFLIDTSGSMEDPSKLPLLRQSFRLMLGELRPEDQVAIVTYAGSSGLVLPPTPASDRKAILAALDGLAAGGSTNGEGGLRQAYDTVEEMTSEGRVGRVILATDGDFNVGLDDPEALERFIGDRAEGGAYLSVLGFGRGNLDDATMQALAQAGNGQAAYIDTLEEAQKVLVDQLTGALFPIADDVKIQVEWNPAEVAEYRLIGYETRALRREDFNDDAVDAGELGAGHAVVALYEVTPVGSPAQLSDPLRYAAEAAPAPNPAPGELGFLRLRWKDPGEGASQLLETPIREGAEVAPEVAEEARFAAAVAGWGQLLRGSDRLGDWGYADAVALAAESRGPDPYGYRSEAVQLMRLSESLAQ